MHEEFGVVYCDVSIDNVMYSTFGDVWKLMGFDVSLPLERSLGNLFQAGFLMLNFMLMSRSFIEDEKP
jgi:hypothetical protein